MHTLVFAFVLCAYVLAGSPLIVAASRAVRRTGENQTPVAITALFWLPDNSDRPELSRTETAYYRMLRRNQRSMKELPTQALLWEGQTHPWTV